jgi:hypothetical protein
MNVLSPHDASRMGVTVALICCMSAVEVVGLGYLHY